jgi:hypothetical protein
MSSLHRTLLAMLMAGTLSPACAAPTDDTATLLRELRQAYGGEHWNHVGALQFEGKETSDGLIGSWQGAHVSAVG